MDIIGLYVLYFSFWVHDFYLSEFSLPKLTIIWLTSKYYTKESNLQNWPPKNPLDEHTAKDVLITHFILNVYYFNCLHPNTVFLTMAFSLLWRAGSIKFFSLASQIETSQYSDYLSTSLAHKLNAGHKSSSS